MNPCPADCGRLQKSGQFLCLPCWKSLPSTIRAAVNRTYQNVSTIDREKNSVGFIKAVRDYHRACDGALRHLRAHPAPAPSSTARQSADELFNH